MRKFGLLPVAVCTVVLTAASTAFAAETGGCDSFPWSVKTELQWMKASESEALKSGAKLPSPPEKAIALSLQPMSAVSFPVAPTGRLKPEGDVYGGFVNFDGPSSAPGLYQVTLQTGGWVDVVQDGKSLKPTAHSGKSDCDGVRKTLRFNLDPGPFTVEFSNIKKDSIKFAIRQAE
ncbi:hypothetical protein [Hyphomicrobium facile]|uniref:PA14 domain-containing protein n=1 Tax=Hyphomicrobium facile TaxID=51670 RepID=A0A1I7NT50_9HYPH|nr:hypothetical protein [Hyphomicrobium facile]SFV37768.1 hypothetical protein SAMN04488557_3329 [Hyphomicrobium facile]